MTKRVSLAAAGGEVARFLGACEPVCQSDPGPPGAPLIVPGRKSLSMRFRLHLVGGPAPAAWNCKQGAKGWTCFIRVAPASTCTRRRWWPPRAWSKAAKSAADVQTFETTTAGLMALAEWLSGHGVTSVAMEATGVYWKPVWHILSTTAASSWCWPMPQHVKAVPGRKPTFPMRSGLPTCWRTAYPRSFVQPRGGGGLRKPDAHQEAADARAHLAHPAHPEDAGGGQHQARQRDLRRAGPKRAGDAGAIIAGETDPERLAELAGRRIKASTDTLARMLDGRPTEVHRVLLRLHLDQIDALDGHRGHRTARGGPSRPLSHGRRAGMTVPGMARAAQGGCWARPASTSAAFPSEGQFLSWACVVPRNDESAGTTARAACERGATGSRPRWCNGPGPGSARATATSPPLHRLKPQLGAGRAISPSPPRCCAHLPHAQERHRLRGKQRRVPRGDPPSGSQTPHPASHQTRLRGRDQTHGIHRWIAFSFPSDPEAEGLTPSAARTRAANRHVVRRVSRQWRKCHD